MKIKKKKKKRKKSLMKKMLNLNPLYLKNKHLKIVLLEKEKCL